MALVGLNVISILNVRATIDHMCNVGKYWRGQWMIDDGQWTMNYWTGISPYGWVNISFMFCIVSINGKVKNSTGEF